MIQQIALDLIFTRKDARKLDDAAVRGLVSSISEVGIINPLRVRPVIRHVAGVETDAYEVTAGAHRLKAARKIGLETVPCIVADDDEDANIASGNTAQKEQPKEQPKKANSNEKKELTRDHINNESAMESISKWIYKNEKKAKESNQSFSVESLINKSYIVGKVEMESIIEIYNNYKINNNLS